MLRLLAVLALIAAPHPQPALAHHAATATNALGFDLERHAPAGNTALSPYSVWSALTMPYAGASGKTRAEMARVLRVRKLDAGKADRALADAINASAAQSHAQLSLASALWGDQASQFEPPFLDTLERNYGAPLQRADFRGDPANARQLIDAWVADRTQQKITDLFSASDITSNTRLVLANALYFKAAWATEFDPDKTSDATFHAPSRNVQVPMMSRDGRVPYARVNGATAVDLPYKGGRLSMLVLLPPRGKLKRFEASLTAARLARITSHLKQRAIDLRMPRFTVATTLPLVNPLKRLGMRRAFTDKATFPRISKAEKLQIQAVQHKVFVQVGEKGTEAAAATGIAMGPTAIEVARRVVVDRPFLFVVRDRRTGAALFLGRVANPA